MDLKSMILDLAGEDYTGLWELVWRANTVKPAEDESAVIPNIGARWKD